MTWIKFAVWLAGLYALYYGALIFWDYFHTGKNAPEQEKHVLTFVEDIAPERSLLDEPESSAGDSPVTHSGGVSLKHLFNLAREEAIEFIRPVSF